MSLDDYTPQHVRQRRRARWLRLQELGYADYATYLRSPHWKAIKDAYRTSDRQQDCICGETLVDLHHKTYDRIGAEELDDLQPLCRRCHQAIHVLEQQRLATLDASMLLDDNRAAEYVVQQDPILDRATEENTDALVDRQEPWRTYSSLGAYVDFLLAEARARKIDPWRFERAIQSRLVALERKIRKP